MPSVGDLVVSVHEDLEGTGLIIAVYTHTMPSKLVVLWDTGIIYQEWEDEVRLMNE